MSESLFFFGPFFIPFPLFSSFFFFYPLKKKGTVPA